MNMTTHNVSFCDFIKIENNSYECKNCGNIVTIYDSYGEPPIFPCQNSLKREKEPLSFAKKVKNFGKSVVNHAIKGFPTCTEEQIIKRHNICMKCEHMQNNTCSQCGCPLMRNKMYVSKLAWADEECPVGKWGKETIS